MGALVSVIVPVYNVEQTVERCVRSLLNQSWRNLEVVAVDGGSSDGTLRVLQRIAQEDSRLRVYSREQRQGVAESRNWAIAQARGEYLQFADGDDWAEPDATERMVRAMEDQACDMVIAGYTEVLEPLKIRRGLLKEDAVLSRDAFLELFSRRPNAFYYSVLWNKLYRRELVEAHGVCCDPQLNWGEDFAFNVEYYRWTERIAVLADPVYDYVRNPRGLTVAMTRRCLSHPIDSMRIKARQYRRYVELFASVGLYESYRYRLLKYLFSFALMD